MKYFPLNFCRLCFFSKCKHSATTADICSSCKLFSTWVFNPKVPHHPLCVFFNLKICGKIKRAYMMPNKSYCYFEEEY